MSLCRVYRVNGQKQDVEVERPDNFTNFKDVLGLAGHRMIGMTCIRKWWKKGYIVEAYLVFEEGFLEVPYLEVNLCCPHIKGDALLQVIVNNSAGHETYHGYNVMFSKQGADELVMRWSDMMKEFDVFRRTVLGIECNYINPRYQELQELVRAVKVKPGGLRACLALADAIDTESSDSPDTSGEDQ